MKKICLILFINIFIFNCKEIKYKHSNEENNLYFVFTTFRHGARYPYFKKDVFNNKIKTPGHLTSYGIKQNLNLGKKLRKKYYKFLNLKEKKFDRQQIYVRSSNIKRTKISTIKQLEGLLKTKKIDHSYIDVVNIRKRIMYLYSFNNTETEEMFNYFKSCNLREVSHKEKLKEKLNNNIISLFKKCYGKLGNIHKKQSFCDSTISAFYQYKYNNMKSNKIGKCGSELATIFYNFCVDFYNSLKKWNEKRAYLMYAFFNNMFIYMQNAIDKVNKLKMIMIGGHDNTLNVLLNFFNGMNIINKTEYPYFAYNIIFELRKYNQKYYIEIYYNDILKYNKTLEKFKDTLYQSKYSKLYNYCGIINLNLTNSTNNTNIIDNDEDNDVVDDENDDNDSDLNGIQNNFNSSNNSFIYKEKIIKNSIIIQISWNIICIIIIIKLLHSIFNHYKKKRTKITFINKKSLFDEKCPILNEN